MTDLNAGPTPVPDPSNLTDVLLTQPRMTSAPPLSTLAQAVTGAEQIIDEAIPPDDKELADAAEQIVEPLVTAAGTALVPIATNALVSAMPPSPNTARLQWAETILGALAIGLATLQSNLHQLPHVDPNVLVGIPVAVAVTAYLAGKLGHQPGTARVN